MAYVIIITNIYKQILVQYLYFIELKCMKFLGNKIRTGLEFVSQLYALGSFSEKLPKINNEYINLNKK